jgi:hypothetical protein
MLGSTHTWKHECREQGAPVHGAFKRCRRQSASRGQASAVRVRQRPGHAAGAAIPRHHYCCCCRPHRSLQTMLPQRPPVLQPQVPVLRAAPQHAGALAQAVPARRSTHPWFGIESGSHRMLLSLWVMHRPLRLRRARSAGRRAARCSCRPSQCCPGAPACGRP